MTLAFAATADGPTAVLTSPVRAVGTVAPGAGSVDTFGMTRAQLERSPLTVTAAVVWSSDLPRHVQQVLFDAAADHSLAS